MCSLTQTATEDVASDVDTLILTNCTYIQCYVAIYVSRETTTIYTCINSDVGIIWRKIGAINNSDTNLFSIGFFPILLYRCRADINSDITFYRCCITTAKDLTNLTDIHILRSSFIGLFISIDNTLHGINPDTGITYDISRCTISTSEHLTNGST